MDKILPAAPAETGYAEQPYWEMFPEIAHIPPVISVHGNAGEKDKAQKCAPAQYREKAIVVTYYTLNRSSSAENPGPNAESRP